MAAHLPSQFSLTTNPRRSTEQPLEHHFAKVVYGEFRKKAASCGESAGENPAA
jgi:hypothetical protein